MSMNGQFVQVAPDQLAGLIDDPSGIEDLFVPSSGVPAGSMEKFVGLMESKRKEFLELGPKMFEATLERMDPKLRDAMRERLGRLGMDPAGLKSGAGGEALMKLMMARAGRRSGGAAQGRAASLSIDKAWHGIHYLLCGAAEPNTTLISKAILGGAELGDDFSGYGPARYFDVNETAAMSSELSRGNLEAEMTARYNPSQMEKLGIYPNGWSGPDGQWLMREFQNVRAFFSDARAKGFAIVTCLV